jgi:hypothetical protein
MTKCGYCDKGDSCFTVIVIFNDDSLPFFCIIYILVTQLPIKNLAMHVKSRYCYTN